MIAGYGLAQIVLAVIIIAALIAICVVAVRGMGLTIPPWAVQIFWIVVIAIVAIVAVKIVLSL